MFLKNAMMIENRVLEDLNRKGSLILFNFNSCFFSRFPPADAISFQATRGCGWVLWLLKNIAPMVSLYIRSRCILWICFVICMSFKLWTSDLFQIYIFFFFFGKEIIYFPTGMELTLFFFAAVSEQNMYNVKYSVKWPESSHANHTIWNVMKYIRKRWKPHLRSPQWQTCVHHRWREPTWAACFGGGGVLKQSGSASCPSGLHPGSAPPHWGPGCCPHLPSRSGPSGEHKGNSTHMTHSWLCLIFSILLLRGGYLQLG